MDLRKHFFGSPQYVSRTDTEANSPDPDPREVWSFTDPEAREVYMNQGQLEQLERDIRFEVMRGGPWLREELEYKIEIRRLLKEGTITDKGTYWYRSPHSTVYRAQGEGKLRISEWTYHFSPGDDLTFQCRMERDEDKEDSGPALVSRFDPAENVVLCGEMSSSMRGMRKSMGSVD